jgi:DNA modification methylase
MHDFLRESCANMLAVTRGAIYICMSSSELHTLVKAFTEAGGHWSTFIIWAKNHFTLGRSDYQRQYEPILYGWAEGTPHYWCGARDQGDVWSIDRPSVNDLHPTMKPVELVQKAVRNSSKSRGLVFDPFGGSGSTLIACETTGRLARLLELETSQGISRGHVEGGEITVKCSISEQNGSGRSHGRGRKGIGVLNRDNQPL